MRNRNRPAGAPLGYGLLLAALVVGAIVYAFGGLIFS